MDNFLDNGTVLPHGLLGENKNAWMAGFNKTYKNTALRIGVVTQIYPVDDDQNLSGLCNEYDVSVIEQHEDKSVTTITYKNCIASEGFGSIADFFERTYRKLEEKTTKGSAINISDQNGAVVLLLCLDGISDKGVIMGGFHHPDRETNITDEGPYLEGEFNGINIKVDTDGSASLAFNGATDNDGDPVDDSQGITTIDIEADGSVQIQNDGVTFRLDRTEQTVTLTAEKDINVTAQGNITFQITGDATVNCNNANINTEADATITAKGTATVEGKAVNLGASATDAVIKGDTFKKYFDTHIHPTAVGPSGPATVPMPAGTLSKKVKTE